jgi:hypothetical protein
MTDQLTKDQEFSPTSAMKLYAFQRSKAGEDATDKEISQKIGVRAETVSRWKSINGFSEWLEEQMSVYRAPVLELLERVALERLGEFRYWEAVANKFGFLKEIKADEGNDSKLIIQVSCDCEEARAKISTQ